jgi:integrase/recombinase XerD
MVKLSQALENVQEAKLGAGCSLQTVDRYAYAVGKLQDRLGDVDLEAVAARDVRGLLAAMRLEGLALHTLETVHRTLNAFWNFCAAEYHVPSPMGAVERPRTPNKLPPYLTTAQVAALFQAVEKTHNQAKNRAILAFLFDTGVRSGELRTLRRDRVDLAKRRAQVVGKGRKERIVPFSISTRAALMVYWEGRSDAWPWAFHSQQAADGQYTASGVRSLLRRLAEYAGLEVRVYPHLCRHTFACRWVQAGGDVETLRRILGHSSIAVTLKYLGLVVDDLQAKHDELKPLGGVT